MNRQGWAGGARRWLAETLGCGSWGRTIWRSKDRRRWITWALWFSHFDIDADSGILLSFDERERIARYRIFWVLGLRVMHWEFPA